jgi:flagellar hook-associated protein 3 FlgL
VFGLANRKDTNGQPLFAALGSALAPFVGPQTTAPDYTFNGLPGQSTSSEVSIPFALDGDSAFMLQVARDGVYNVSTSGPSALSSTPLAVNIALSTPPAPVTDSSYTIGITAIDPVAGTASYNVVETTTAVPPVTTTTPVTSGYMVGAPLSITAVPGRTITISGNPTVGDSISIVPSPSIFSVLDNAIRDIGNAPSNAAATQAVSQALGNIDIGMGRISAVRGQAGDLLNRADAISANQDARSIQLETDRSNAEDIDMVKGISDFQKAQTGYQAALQSYAQVQKLSLFNYIG